MRMALRQMNVEVAFDINDTPLGRLNAALDEMKGKMLGGSIDKFEDDLGDANKETKLLGSSISETANQTKLLGSSVDKTGKNIKQSGNDANNSSKKMKLLGSAAQAAGQAFEWLGRKSNNVIKGIGRGLLSIPRKIGSFLTHPLSLLGIGGGMYGVVSSGLGMVMEEQNITSAFKVLLGSAEKAQQRVQELTTFAGQTPYKREEIYEASRVLEVFTKGALSTGEGLKMVGDIAAGTQQQFGDVALWVGRLYDAMQSGRPVGEMTSRLQEMGAIDGMARDKIEKLAKSGQKIAKTWPVVTKEFSRFDGMMEDLSNNLQNLLLGTKTFFTQNVIKRIGYGLNEGLDPFLRKFRQWRKDNGDTIKLLGQQVEDFARKLSTSFFRKIENAFSFVKTRYLDNPEFMNLDFLGKVEFIFGDIKSMFDNWYNGGGKEQIRKITGNVAQFLAEGLQMASGPIISASLEIGKGIGSGILNGLQEIVKDHPLLSGLVAGTVTPGPWYTKVATGLATTGVASVEKSKDVSDQIRYENRNRAPETIEKLSKIPSSGNFSKSDAPLISGTSLNTYKDNRNVFQKMYDDFKNNPFWMGSHAFGLSNVPYNGYVAELHKGERVLTAEENKRYNSSNAPVARGGGMPNVNITVNVESKGAAAGGTATIRADAKTGAKEALDEFWRSMIRINPPTQEV